MTMKSSITILLSILSFSWCVWAQSNDKDANDEHCPTIFTQEGLITPEAADCQQPELQKKVMAKQAKDCLFAIKAKSYVRFKLRVNEQGEVDNVEVISDFGQGKECLAAWVKAIMKWKYTPYIYKGNPVSFYIVVSLNFSTDR